MGWYSGNPSDLNNLFPKPAAIIPVIFQVASLLATLTHPQGASIL